MLEFLVIALVLLVFRGCGCGGWALFSRLVCRGFGLFGWWPSYCVGLEYLVLCLAVWFVRLLVVAAFWLGLDFAGVICCSGFWVLFVWWIL